MKWVISIALMLAIISCQEVAEKKVGKVDKIVLEADEYDWARNLRFSD